MYVAVVFAIIINFLSPWNQMLIEPSLSFPTPFGASFSRNHLTTLLKVFGLVPAWTVDVFLIKGLSGGSGAFLYGAIMAISNSDAKYEFQLTYRVGFWWTLILRTISFFFSWGICSNIVSGMSGLLATISRAVLMESRLFRSYLLAFCSDSFHCSYMYMIWLQYEYHF